MKIKKSWTGKKEPTNPVRKEQHEYRKTKRTILHHIEDEEWEEQLKDYKNSADSTFQE